MSDSREASDPTTSSSSYEDESSTTESSTATASDKDPSSSSSAISEEDNREAPSKDATPDVRNESTSSVEDASSDDDSNSDESGWSSSASTEGDDSSTSEDAQSADAGASSIESAVFSDTAEIQDVPWMDVSQTPKPLVLTSPSRNQPNDDDEEDVNNGTRESKVEPQTGNPKASKMAKPKITKARRGKRPAKIEQDDGVKVVPAPPFNPNATTEAERAPESTSKSKKQTKQKEISGTTPSSRISTEKAATVKLDKMPAKVHKSQNQSKPNRKATSESKPSVSDAPLKKNESLRENVDITKEAKTKRSKPKEEASVSTKTRISDVGKKQTTKGEVKPAQSEATKDSKSKHNREKTSEKPKPKVEPKTRRNGGTDDGTMSSSPAAIVVPAAQTNDCRKIAPSRMEGNILIDSEHIENSPEGDSSSERSANTENALEPGLEICEPIERDIHQQTHSPQRVERRREEAAPKKQRNREKTEDIETEEEIIRRRRRTGFVLAACFTVVVATFVFAMSMVIIKSMSADDEQPTQIAPGDGVTLCNGLSNLCQVRLNEQMFAVIDSTERSTSQRFRRSLVSTFNKNLAEGYRGFRLQLSWCESTLTTGDCSSGVSSISLLNEVVEFLETNKRDFVALVFEPSNGVTMEDVSTLLWSVAGFTEKMYVYPGDGRPWPLLGALLDAGSQLLVFENSSPQDVCTTCPPGTHVWSDHSVYTNFDQSDISPAQASEAVNCQLVGEPLDFVVVNASNLCSIEESEVDLVELHLRGCASNGHFTNILISTKGCQTIANVVAASNRATDPTFEQWYPLILNLEGLEEILDENDVERFQQECRDFFAERVSRSTNVDCVVVSQTDLGSSIDLQVKVSTDTTISAEGLEIATLTDAVEVHSTNFVSRLQEAFASELQSVEVREQQFAEEEVADGDQTASNSTPNPTVAPTVAPSVAEIPTNSGQAVLPAFFTESPVLSGAVRLPDGLV